MLQKTSISILIAILLLCSLMAAVAAAPEVPSAPDARSCGSRSVQRNQVQVTNLTPISLTAPGVWWQLAPNSTGVVTFTRPIMAVTKVIFSPSAEVSASLSYTPSEVISFTRDYDNLGWLWANDFASGATITSPLTVSLKLEFCDVTEYQYIPLASR